MIASAADIGADDIADEAWQDGVWVGVPPLCGWIDRRNAPAVWLRERVSHATGLLSAYAVAAGLFAAAALFAVCAIIVGLVALFRWVEINYGQFYAFGALGSAFAVLALVCAGIAALSLKRKSRPSPSLPSRLRVAIASPPIPDGTLPRAAKETAAAAGSQIVRNMDAKSASLVFGAIALGGYALSRRFSSGRGR